MISHWLACLFRIKHYPMPLEGGRVHCAYCDRPMVQTVAGDWKLA